MHSYIRCAAIAAIVLWGSLQPATSEAASALSATVRPETVGFDTARLQRLDDYMAQVVSDGRVAGMTTLLARHGKVVSFKTYGKASLATGAPIKKDTIFRIYSMTKPITGVGLMTLFEQGKWRLDDPVTRFVPEFKNMKVVKAVNADGTMVLEDMKRPPAMRELMSHTAGFGYGLFEGHPVDALYRDKEILTSPSLQEMINRTATIPLMFQPGTSWSYSTAVEIQGYIIEKISGQKLSDYLAEHIFKPLKMNDTGFYISPAKAGRLSAVYDFDLTQGRIKEATKLFSMDIPDFTVPPAMESGGGGLLSTTMDYARFAQMILNKGDLDGMRILSPASVELMGTNVIPKDARLNTTGSGGLAGRFNEEVGFGLNFQVVKNARAAGTLQGNGTVSWAGAAGTWFWVDPTNDIIFVGMIQRLGGTGGDDLQTMARTLTYQALTNPEK